MSYTRADIARAANHGAALSSSRGAPRLAADSDRYTLQRWLQWNDPNGSYMDPDADDEDPEFDPLTLPEAWELIRKQCEDENPQENPMKTRRASNYSTSGEYEVLDDNGFVVSRVARSSSGRGWYGFPIGTPGVREGRQTIRAVWLGSTKEAALLRLEQQPTREREQRASEQRRVAADRASGGHGSRGTLVRVLRTPARGEGLVDGRMQRFTYEAALLYTPNNDLPGYILSIKETPGSWYLDTLNESANSNQARGRSSDRVSLYGNDWHILNMDSLLAEANAIAEADAFDTSRRAPSPRYRAVAAAQQEQAAGINRELERLLMPQPGRPTPSRREASERASELLDQLKEIKLPARGRARFAPGFPSPVPYAAPEMEFAKGEWRPLELDDHDRDRSTGESLVEQDARERFAKLEFNPGTPPRGAIKKYLEFHDRDPKATGWLNLKIPSSMGHVGEAKTTYYKSDKWSGKQTNYFHEHDGRVRFCTTESEARKGGADWSPVHLPEFITKTKAIILLGKWMGCDYENGDADVEVRPAGTEELYTIPSGKALIVVASKRAVVAVLWGGTLDVKDVGIVG